jgi:hypothetical protein
MQPVSDAQNEYRHMTHECDHIPHHYGVMGVMFRRDASRRSKTDRRSSKQAAVELLASIAGTDSQQQLVKVCAHGRVSLGSILQRHVYSEMALVLGSAMQAHMECNPVLRRAVQLNNEQVSICGHGPAKCYFAWLEISANLL